MWEDRPIRRLLRRGIFVGETNTSQSKIRQMREAKKREWAARGINSKLISMALDLADQRARGTSSIVPDEYPEARDAVFLQQYEEALGVAEKWLESVA